MGWRRLRLVFNQTVTRNSATQAGGICQMRLAVPPVLLCLLIALPDPVAATADDRGFLWCNVELAKSTQAIASEHWKRGPVYAKFYDPVREYLPAGGKLTRWLSHKNPNGTATVVIENSSAHEDMDSWTVVLWDHGQPIAKALVEAVGFGFSKSYAEGVTGLYFCGKRGLSHEWTRDGSKWN